MYVTNMYIIYTILMLTYNPQIANVGVKYQSINHITPKRVVILFHVFSRINSEKHSFSKTL